MVQLGRLIAWLIRLVFRHPLADLAITITGVVWLQAGWLTVAGLAAGFIAALAVVAVAVAGVVRPVRRWSGSGTVQARS